MQVLFKLLPDNAYIELNLWFHKYNQLIMPRVRDDIRVSNWPFIIARYGDADVALWTAKFSQFDPGHNNIELLTDLHACYLVFKYMEGLSRLWIRFVELAGYKYRY